MNNNDEKILKALETLTDTIRDEMRQGFIQTDKKIEKTEDRILEQSAKEHKQIVEMLFDGFEGEGKYSKSLEKRIEKLEKEVQELKQQQHRS